MFLSQELPHRRGVLKPKYPFATHQEKGLLVEGRVLGQLLSQALTGGRVGAAANCL